MEGEDGNGSNTDSYEDDAMNVFSEMPFENAEDVTLRMLDEACGSRTRAGQFSVESEKKFEALSKLLEARRRPMNNLKNEVDVNALDEKYRQLALKICSKLKFVNAKKSDYPKEFIVVSYETHYLIFAFGYRMPVSVLDLAKIEKLSAAITSIDIDQLAISDVHRIEGGFSVAVNYAKADEEINNKNKRSAERRNSNLSTGPIGIKTSTKRARIMDESSLTSMEGANY